MVDRSCDFSPTGVGNYLKNCHTQVLFQFFWLQEKGVAILNERCPTRFCGLYMDDVSPFCDDKSPKGCE